MARQYDAKLGSTTLVRDDADAITAAADALPDDCDVLALVGGASRGNKDFAKVALQACVGDRPFL